MVLRHRHNYLTGLGDGGVKPTHHYRPISPNNNGGNNNNNNQHNNNDGGVGNGNGDHNTNTKSFLRRHVKLRNNHNNNKNDELPPEPLEHEENLFLPTDTKTTNNINDQKNEMNHHHNNNMDQLLDRIESKFTTTTHHQQHNQQQQQPKRHFSSSLFFFHYYRNPTEQAVEIWHVSAFFVLIGTVMLLSTFLLRGSSSSSSNSNTNANSNSHHTSSVSKSKLHPKQQQRHHHHHHHTTSNTLSHDDPSKKKKTTVQPIASSLSIVPGMTTTTTTVAATTTGTTTNLIPSNSNLVEDWNRSNLSTLSIITGGGLGIGAATKKFNACSISSSTTKQPSILNHDNGKVRRKKTDEWNADYCEEEEYNDDPTTMTTPIDKTTTSNSSSMMEYDCPYEVALLSDSITRGGIMKMDHHGVDRMQVVEDSYNNSHHKYFPYAPSNHPNHQPEQQHRNRKGTATTTTTVMSVPSTSSGSSSHSSSNHQHHTHTHHSTTTTSSSHSSSSYVHAGGNGGGGGTTTLLTHSGNHNSMNVGGVKNSNKKQKEKQQQQLYIPPPISGAGDAQQLQKQQQQQKYQYQPHSTPPFHPLFANAVHGSSSSNVGGGGGLIPEQLLTPSYELPYRSQSTELPSYRSQSTTEIQLQQEQQQLQPLQLQIQNNHEPQTPVLPHRFLNARLLTTTASSFESLVDHPALLSCRSNRNHSSSTSNGLNHHEDHKDNKTADDDDEEGNSLVVVEYDHNFSSSSSSSSSPPLSPTYDDDPPPPPPPAYDDLTYYDEEICINRTTATTPPVVLLQHQQQPLSRSHNNNHTVRYRKREDYKQQQQQQQLLYSSSSNSNRRIVSPGGIKALVVDNTTTTTMMKTVHHHDDIVPKSTTTATTTATTTTNRKSFEVTTPIHYHHHQQQQQQQETTKLKDTTYINTKNKNNNNSNKKNEEEQEASNSSRISSHRGHGIFVSSSSIISQSSSNSEMAFLLEQTPKVTNTRQLLNENDIKRMKMPSNNTCSSSSNYNSNNKQIGKHEMDHLLSSTKNVSFPVLKQTTTRTPATAANATSQQSTQHTVLVPSQTQGKDLTTTFNSSPRKLQQQLLSTSSTSYRKNNDNSFHDGNCRSGNGTTTMELVLENNEYSVGSSDGGGFDISDMCLQFATPPKKKMDVLTVPRSSSSSSSQNVHHHADAATVNMDITTTAAAATATAPSFDDSITSPNIPFVPNLSQKKNNMNNQSSKWMIPVNTVLGGGGGGGEGTKMATTTTTHLSLVPPPKSMNIDDLHLYHCYQSMETGNVSHWEARIAEESLLLKNQAYTMAAASPSPSSARCCDPDNTTTKTTELLEGHYSSNNNNLLPPESNHQKNTSCPSSSRSSSHHHHHHWNNSSEYDNIKQLIHDPNNIIHSVIAAATDVRNSSDDDHSIPSNDPRKSIKHCRGNLTTDTDASSSLQGSSINFSELKLIEVIGGGGFGQVWKAIWLGTPVAVKVLTGSAQSKTVPRAVLEEFAAEINLLKGMRHPNICLYMGACLIPPNRAIITELAANGSLWDALRLPLMPPYVPCDGKTREGWPRVLYQPDSRHGAPPILTSPFRQSQLVLNAVPPSGTWHWVLVKRVANGAARGMAYLHSGKPPILHRDLKSANILLDESYTAKVCDFGLSRLKAQESSMTGNCGTVQWMAPEVLSNERYNEKADVYSYGIICWELLTAECPYDGMTPIQCALAVLNRDQRPEIPKWCPPPLHALIRSCMKKDPELRPTFEEILERLDAMP